MNQSINQVYLVDRHAKAGMIVRGTSIIDVRGIAGCCDTCEEKGGEDLKHACRHRHRHRHRHRLRLRHRHRHRHKRGKVLYTKVLVVSWPTSTT